MDGISFQTAWTVGVALVAVGGGWFLNKRNADDIKEMWKVITKVRDWQSGHEKESGEKRLEIERAFGKIRESIADNATKFDAIMGAIDDLKRTLARLQNGNH